MERTQFAVVPQGGIATAGSGGGSFARSQYEVKFAYDYGRAVSGPPSRMRPTGPGYGIKSKGPVSPGVAGGGIDAAVNATWRELLRELSGVADPGDYVSPASGTPYSYSGFKVEMSCGASSTSCGSNPERFIGRSAGLDVEQCGACTVPAVLQRTTFAAAAADAPTVGAQLVVSYRSNISSALPHWWYRRTAAGVPALLGRAAVPVAMVYPSARRDPDAKVKVQARPDRKLDVDGRYRRKPYVRPAVGTVLRDVPVVGVGSPVWYRTTHKDIPDGAKKVRRVPHALIVLLKLFHAATEFQDFVDALYGAIKVRVRGSKLGKGRVADDLAGKLQLIADNWGLFENPSVVAQALRNLVNNEIEDRVAGRLLGAHFPGVRNYTQNAWVTGSGIVSDNPYSRPPVVHRNYSGRRTERMR